MVKIDIEGLKRAYEQRQRPERNDDKPQNTETDDN